MATTALTLGSVVLYVASALRAFWVARLLSARRDVLLLCGALLLLSVDRAAHLAPSLAGGHGGLPLAAVEFVAASLLLLALVYLPAALRRLAGSGANEARVRFLLESGDDAVFVMDAAAGTVLAVNDHLTELAGRARDEVTGGSPLLLAPDLTPAFLSDLLRPLREGRVPWVRTETLFRRKDGSTRPVGVHVQWGTYGSLEVLLVVAVDVTGRKAAEEEARAARRRLEDAQEVARLASWEWDLTTDTLVWSDELFRMFEREPGSFQPRFESILERMHPDDREPVRAAVRQAKARGEGFDTEYRIALSDRGVRWIHVSARMEKDGQGRPVRLRGVSQDITRLRRAEEALAASAARYRRLFEQAPVSLWEEDVSAVVRRLDALRAGGVEDLRAHLEAHPEEVDALVGLVRVLDVNPAAVALHGADSPETLKGPMRVDLADGSRSGFVEILLALHQRRPHCQVLSEQRAPDGSRRSLLVSTNLPVAPEHEGIALVSIVDLTARADAERALRSREAELSQALDAARMGVWHWDMRTGEVGWTDEAYAVFGDAGAGFDGTLESYMALLHPDDLPLIQADIASAVAGAGDYRTEVRLRPDAAGRVRWVAGAGKVEFAPDGAPSVLHGLVWDVTAQREAERALLQTEARLAWVVDHAPVVVFALDATGLFTLSKGKALAMLGLQADEVLGRSVFDVYRDEPAVLDAVQRAMAGEEVVGSVRLGAAVFEVRYHPTRESDEGPWEVIGIATDITGVVEAEAEQAKLAAVVEGTEEFIGLATPEGEPTYLNPAALELLGLESLDSVRGLPVSAFLARPEAYEAELLPALRSVGSWKGEVRLVRFDTGAHVPCFANAFLIRGADGTPLAMAAVARDLREEREAAQERERMERQLRQSQKMETIGTLAGGIAHDFNNLLTPILGYAQIMEEELPEGAAAREDLQEIVHAAARAKDLVQQILSFSRQREQDHRPLDVAPILREATRLLKATLPSAIDVRLRVEDGCGWVQGDATQLHQVVLNLATNALHAMKERNGVLALGLAEVVLDEVFTRGHPGLAAGRYLRLTVSDTGRGMSPQVLERVFEPFFTTKGPGEGTGLGLSVVHGIVANHGGVLTLYSEEGEGTTVNVYLPVAATHGAAAEIGVDADVPQRSRRILVVDDREDVAALVRRMLRTLGHEAETALGGEEALEWISRAPGHFDILVTDYSMPGMSGIELVRRVREIRPDLPVVMASGFSEALTPELLAAEGVGAFLMKPFVTRELARALERAWAR